MGSMKIKLPSVRSLWLQASMVVRRFPLQVLIAVAASVILCFLVGLDSRNGSLNDVLIKSLLVLNFGLALLLSADLFAEARRWSAGPVWTMRLLVILLCLGLFLLLDPQVFTADKYRVVLLAFAFHLLVSFAPFTGGSGTLNDFWLYNKSLFIRFLTAALYAAVLYAGLAIALAAVDGLFAVQISYKVYLSLFSIVAAGFMTVFFLAGVPTVFVRGDLKEAYPKGLKVFTQYVLIPLMAIYLGILLVYELKIIVNGELPKGLVSMLILGYAVFGILSLLLVYPIRTQEGHGWIRLFSRFFYVMMIPLVILLLLAVWARVSRYGVTEPRYLLVILALWLAFITVYFLLSRKQNIMLIPVSLCVLALLAVYGPQSASSLSRFSQQSRLKKLMASKDKEDVAQRAGVVDYLVDMHGLPALQAFTKRDLADVEQRILRATESTPRFTRLAAQKDSAFAILKVTRPHEVMRYVVLKPTGGALQVSGYDYVIPVNGYSSRRESEIGSVPVVVEHVAAGKLHLQIGTAKVVQLDLTSAFNKLSKIYQKGAASHFSGDSFSLPEQYFSLCASAAGYDYCLKLTSVSFYHGDAKPDEPEAQPAYEGYLLIRVK